MKYLSLGIILAVVLSSSTAFAEPFIVTVPGQSWQIGFSNLPLLAEYQGKTQGKRFIFLGKSAQVGLMVSVTGEPWTSGGNVECRSAVWSKISQNPVIDKGSVKITENEKFSQVIYMSNVDVKGKKIKQVNAGFYFVFDATCVDVHLTKIPYATGDEQALINIANKMAWGRSR